MEKLNYKDFLSELATKSYWSDSVNTVFIDDCPYDNTVSIGRENFTTTKYERTKLPFDVFMNMIAKAIVKQINNYPIEDNDIKLLYETLHHKIDKLIMRQKLTFVTIPDGMTCIGKNAFKGYSSLTSISIPDGVRCIGDSAFAGCTGLATIDIPNSVTYIGSNAFDECI